MIYILEGPLGVDKEKILKELKGDYKIVYKPTISNVKNIIDYLKSKKEENIVIVSYFGNDFILNKNFLKFKGEQEILKLEKELVKLNDFLEESTYIKCIKQDCDVQKCIDARVNLLNETLSSVVETSYALNEVKKFAIQEHYEYTNWLFKILTSFK